jgi:Protein of unknown function (DUF2924)
MTRPSEKTVAAEVMALQDLTVGELRERYLDLFGEETRSRNKTWLFRACAWRVQELAFGGLSERAKRRAAEIYRESDVRPRRHDVVPPLPGTNTKVIAFQPKPVLELLIERVAYDGAARTVALTFRATGIQALAEEVTP